MNKRVVIFSVLVIAIFLIFRFCSSKPDQVKEVDQKPSPLSVSQNSAPFNQSFAGLLQSYYSLKNAFTTADIAKANSAAAQLAQNADSLHIDELQGDTSGTIRETARYFAGTISTSAKSITTNTATEAKLSDFNMVTDALWSLTRTVKFDGQKVYYHFCSEALGQQGGYWLSDKIDTQNPYGLKANCSGVADSLDYSRK